MIVDSDCISVVFYSRDYTKALSAEKVTDYRGCTYWAVKYTDVYVRNGVRIAGPTLYARSENGMDIPRRVINPSEVEELAKKIGLLYEDWTFKC